MISSIKKLIANFTQKTTTNNGINFHGDAIFKTDGGSTINITTADNEPASNVISPPLLSPDDLVLSTKKAPCVLGNNGELIVASHGVGLDNYRALVVARVLFGSSLGEKKVHVEDAFVFPADTSVEAFSSAVLDLLVEKDLLKCTHISSKDGEGRIAVRLLEGAGVDISNVIHIGTPCFKESNKDAFLNKRAQCNIEARDAIKSGRLTFSNKVTTEYFDLLREVENLTIVKPNEKARISPISKKSPLWDAICFFFLEDIDKTLKRPLLISRKHGLHRYAIYKADGDNEIANILRARDGSWYPDFLGCSNCDAEALRFVADLVDKLNANNDGLKPVEHEHNVYDDYYWWVYETGIWSKAEGFSDFNDALQAVNKTNAQCLRVFNGQESDTSQLANENIAGYATLDSKEKIDRKIDMDTLLESINEKH